LKKYECVIVFDGLSPDDEIKALQEKAQHIITQEGGEITKIDVWGKRRLAYDIKRTREGYYILIYFHAEKPAPVLSELDRFCRIEEKVLRHIICHELPPQYSQPVPEGKEAEESGESKPDLMEGEKSTDLADTEDESKEEEVEKAPDLEEKSLPDLPLQGECPPGGQTQGSS
jgi:small subunit ribosomal protein S6